MTLSNPPELSSIPLSHLIPLILALLLIYIITLFLYRVYFSPLSHIPGSKLAAATSWYSFYFDALKIGRYFVEVEKIHRKYGPIVRITPTEIHIDDPTFFNELYNVTKRLDKDPWYYSWLGRNGSIFAMTDPDQHKLCSSVIKKAMSTASISHIEPVLKSHYDVFCRRLSECKERKNLVPLSDMWRSIAVDIITDLAIPESFNLLETPYFGAAHADFNRHITFLVPLLERVPRWLLALKGRTALNVIDEIEHQKEQVKRLIANNGKPISGKNYPVIMNEVYASDLPAKEKTVKRLCDEIGILIGAGSETMGHTLATITYHILANPNIHKRLKDEIRRSCEEAELEDVLSYKKLEGLPYLNACINEGLRLATGVSGRLPRINKSQVTTYTSLSNKSYYIPPGIPISMTIRDMHYNATYFPSPRNFNPERWLDPDLKSKSEKVFAPFGRGSRSCVGKNLAMAELLMGIGNLFGRFEVEMDERETRGRESVELVHDCFSPFVKRSSKGVVVRIQ
ncbi:putative cytochrome P450 [Zopfia rhizophila CBS 207.26]|uniref:Putative cytochrome P450 n=1 Tax=Zopfia rhizophila CBS 207.26 TaxID=1314779 RepID=A0A6A6EVA2_9PEZI|nr:putative cytochrome P450 [Zopfia rhizophila CBS 207.26]